MATPKRKHITLACTVCGDRNYTSEKNSTNDPERKEFKKFCRRCKARTVHKETK